MLAASESFEIDSQWYEGVTRLQADEIWSERFSATVVALTDKSGVRYVVATSGFWSSSLTMSGN